MIARLEEATCLARFPDHHDAARVYADDAMGIATKGTDAALLSQARLMYGQCMELLGDDTAARSVYNAALSDAEEGQLSVGHGRIALHLGRLQAAGGQGHLAGRHLDLALELGLAHGDPSLLQAALGPTVEHHLAQGDEGDAAAALRNVVQAFAKAGQEGPILQHAAETWGEARVAGWLKG